MAQLPGIPKADLIALPRVTDRMTFLYVERCQINRHDGAITFTDIRGTVYVPAAAICVLMLGPGTEITHRAMELMSNVGTTTIWVGEHGVRYYAHGRPLTRSTNLLTRQAELVTNTRSRIAVARQMYQMRFPNEDVSRLTMQQLRGREGARVAASYRQWSRKTGVPWKRRNYDPEDFAGGDPINQALSAAHSCLYGVVHSVIVALGCSPGLGFVHTGHEKSFVYDIADLYKAETTVPIAFEIAAEFAAEAASSDAESDKPRDTGAEIGGRTRRRVRDVLAKGKILERAVKDISTLLKDPNASQDDPEIAPIYLWDLEGLIAHGVSYAPAAGYGSD